MTQLVAVYGSLKKGLHNHSLLEGAEFVGEGKTLPVYTMHNLGSYPGIRPYGKTAISYEVYKVNEHEFAALDTLEGYPYYYDREQINTEFGQAWIYFLSKPCDEPVVQSGQWYGGLRLVGA